jgi:hypothetical protein
MSHSYTLSGVRKILFTIVWVFLLLSGCQKDEEGISSRTGNLEITFKNSSPVRFREYFLYSEAVYFSTATNRSGLWLRRGGAGSNRIDIKGLNPGNYVILIALESGTETTGFVQVTPNQTNKFTL